MLEMLSCVMNTFPDDWFASINEMRLSKRNLSDEIHHQVWTTWSTKLDVQEQAKGYAALLEAVAALKQNQGKIKHK